MMVGVRKQTPGSCRLSAETCLHGGYGLRVPGTINRRDEFSLSQKDENQSTQRD